ncbi:hypothetical protein AURDEDRAFT_160606 [Auricularia subglabra TFB-10046 SS5]|nr:hypothetical protein AURDEDRAFT_160606 [Auricularia subglabra TFB-10046 SS5]
MGADMTLPPWSPRPTWLAVFINFCAAPTRCRYLVFPSAKLETFRNSCNAMLRQLNRRAREIQAAPVPTSPYGPHTPPSSPMASPGSSSESDDDGEFQDGASPAVKLVAYAIFDTVSGTILGICMSPEAEGAVRTARRLRSSFRAGVKLVSLCAVVGDAAVESPASPRF